jgi:hypothetical protein
MVTYSLERSAAPAPSLTVPQFEIKSDHHFVVTEVIRYLLADRTVKHTVLDEVYPAEFQAGFFRHEINYR